MYSFFNQLTLGELLLFSIVRTSHVLEEYIYKLCIAMILS